MPEYKIIEIDKRKRKVVKREVEKINLPENWKEFKKRIDKYSEEKGYKSEEQELPFRFYKDYGLYIGCSKESVKIKYFIQSEEEWW